MSLKLSKVGYIFGLGAFRRYEQHFGKEISHFDETFKPSREAFEAWASRQENPPMIDTNKPPYRTISDIEVNHRWAVMLKCAHDVWLTRNEGEEYTVDDFEMMIDEAPQEEWNIVQEHYLDSMYLGKKLRVLYGIPEPEPQSKKKASASTKRSPSPAR